MTGTWTATVGLSGTWSEDFSGTPSGKSVSPADLLKIVQPKR
jgi:hypothetical protein